MLQPQTEHGRLAGTQSLCPACMCVTVLSIAKYWSASCADGYPPCADIFRRCSSSLSGRSVHRWTSMSECCSQTRLARASMCQSCSLHRGLAQLLLYTEDRLFQSLMVSTVRQCLLTWRCQSHLTPLAKLAVILSFAHFRVGSRPLLARTIMRIGTPAKSKSLRIVFISCRRVRSDRATVRVNTANVGGRALTCTHRSGSEVA